MDDQVYSYPEEEEGKRRRGGGRPWVAFIAGLILGVALTVMVGLLTGAMRIPDVEGLSRLRGGESSVITIMVIIFGVLVAIFKARLRGARWSQQRTRTFGNTASTGEPDEALPARFIGVIFVIIGLVIAGVIAFMALMR